MDGYIHQRTYQPKLVSILRLLCKYGKRWERQLKEHMTPTQRDLLDAVLSACEALEDAISLSQGV